MDATGTALVRDAGVEKSSRLSVLVAAEAEAAGDTAQARKVLALAAGVKGAEATSDVGAAVSAVAGNTGVALRLGALAMGDASSLDEAAETARAIAEAAPDSAQAWQLAAEVAADAGDWAGARQACVS